MLGRGDGFRFDGTTYQLNTPRGQQHLFLHLLIHLMAVRWVANTIAASDAAGAAPPEKLNAAVTVELSSIAVVQRHGDAVVVELGYGPVFRRSAFGQPADARLDLRSSGAAHISGTSVPARSSLAETGRSTVPDERGVLPASRRRGSIAGQQVQPRYAPASFPGRDSAVRKQIRRRQVRLAVRSAAGNGQQPVKPFSGEILKCQLPRRQPAENGEQRLRWRRYRGTVRGARINRSARLSRAERLDPRAKPTDRESDDARLAARRRRLALRPAVVHRRWLTRSQQADDHRRGRSFRRSRSRRRQRPRQPCRSAVPSRMSRTKSSRRRTAAAAAVRVLRRAAPRRTTKWPGIVRMRFSSGRSNRSNRMIVILYDEPSEER